MVRIHKGSNRIQARLVRSPYGSRQAPLGLSSACFTPIAGRMPPCSAPSRCGLARRCRGVRSRRRPTVTGACARRARRLGGRGGLPTFLQVLFSCLPPDFFQAFRATRTSCGITRRMSGHRARVLGQARSPENAGLSPPTSPAARLLCCQSSTVSCDKSWRSSSPRCRDLRITQRSSSPRGKGRTELHFRASRMRRRVAGRQQSEVRERGRGREP
jgi:hypothetical protein